MPLGEADHPAIDLAHPGAVEALRVVQQARRQALQALRVLQGSFSHHAVPGNVRRLDIFRKEVCRAWLHALLDAGECRTRSTAVR